MTTTKQLTQDPKWSDLFSGPCTSQELRATSHPFLAYRCILCRITIFFEAITVWETSTMIVITLWQTYLEGLIANPTPYLNPSLKFNSRSSFVLPVSLIFSLLRCQSMSSCRVNKQLLGLVSPKLVVDRVKLVKMVKTDLFFRSRGVVVNVFVPCNLGGH
jgi:hypothetical protein